MSTNVRVSRISIAPVKSLGLQHPEVVELTETGVAEDRRFYLVDHAGRLVDRLVSGPLVRIGAWTDPAASRLRLEFPDGTVLDGEVRLGDAVTHAIYDRTAEGHVVEGPWAAAIEPIAGRPVRLIRCDRPGGSREGDEVSLVSDGSLRELAAHAERWDVDARRFRMLFEIEGAAAHEEDTWIGQSIEIGAAVVRITEPDARCAITTQDPDTGVRDLDTLRTIIGYRGLRDGRKADFGVLGTIETPGVVRVGDPVTVR